MYSLMDFGWQAEGGVTVIAGRVERMNDSGEIEVVADFTGDNALRFPDIWSQLTDEQQHDLMQHIASRLLLLRAGLGS